jgi:hypothetical protein
VLRVAPALAIVTAVLASGCNRGTAPVRGPDGRLAFEAACRHSPVECYVEASERCPTGYDVIERRVPDDATGHVDEWGNTGARAVEPSRMVYSCRDPVPTDEARPQCSCPCPRPVPGR